MQEAFPEQANTAQVWCQGHYSKFLPKHPGSTDTENEKPVSLKPDRGHSPFAFVLTSIINTYLPLLSGKLHSVPRKLRCFNGTS